MRITAPSFGCADASQGPWPPGRRLATLSGSVLAGFGAILVAAVPSMAATVTGSSHGVKATMQVSTHNPKVKQPWPLRITVTEGGKSVKATVSYEWLYAGVVVAGPRERQTFTGHFSENLEWPASALGKPLTFRALVVVGKATVDLDYTVTVIR